MLILLSFKQCSEGLEQANGTQSRHKQNSFKQCSEGLELGAVPILRALFVVLKNVVKV